MGDSKVKGFKPFEKIKDASKEWDNIFEFISDLVFIADRNYKFVRVNKATCDFLKKKPKELIGKRCFKVLYGIDKPCPNCPHKKMLVTKKSETQEINDPRLGTLLVSVSPIFDDSGKLIGGVHVLKNITERKKAEDALKESEEKFRTIFEGATDGILVANPTTKRFKFANPEISKITGYSLKELLKLSVNDIHPKKDLPYVIDQFTKQIRGKMTLAKNIPILRKDKKIVYCDVNSKSIEFGKNKYLVGFFRDITERKRMEEEIKKNLTELKKLDAEKNEFISIAAHELKTPMTTIHGFAQLLENENIIKDVETRNKYLKIIEDEIKRLNKLVTDVLDRKSTRLNSSHTT